MTRTVFIPCRARADVKAVVESVLENVPQKRIGLVSTAQFAHQLEEIEKGLEEGGKTALIAPGRPNPGQVLGCDARAAGGQSRGTPGEPDCYVYLGTGRFHPLRVAEETGKPAYAVKPGGELEKVSKRELMRRAKRRAARIDAFKRAGRVGIIVSTKPGQSRMGRALKLKEELEPEKQTFIFIANEIKPDSFAGYDVDAWVSTACPRIAEDSFEAPMVDISEI